MEPISEETIFTDPLTGLYNRKYFFNTAGILMEQAARYGHPLSVLVLDIDHFNQINDTYGRAVGDEVLKHLAGNIQQTVRTADIAARLEGDKFVIIMSQTDTPQAVRLAQRIQFCVAENPMHAEQSNFHITLSMGVACSFEKKDIPSIKVLLELADRALHQAKRSERDKISVYDPN